MRLAALMLAVTSVTAAAAIAADAEVKAMMAGQVNPSALAFWAGGNDPPEGEAPADAEARWRTAQAGAEVLRDQGVKLSESVHARPGRWAEYAKLLSDTAAEGVLAAQARDAERAFEIGGRMYDACNGCHKAYIPTPRLP